jgi:hypothetical protein
VAEGEAEARLLIRDLNQVPVTLRRQMTRTIRKAGGPIVSRAKANASWSSRIPGAISLRTRYTGNRPGISIRVSARKAPHARAYEGLTGNGQSFQHPVFGHRDRWVTQSTRPFLFPAAQAEGQRVVDGIAQAIDVSARLHGWR